MLDVVKTINRQTEQLKKYDYGINKKEDKLDERFYINRTGR